MPLARTAKPEARYRGTAVAAVGTLLVVDLWVIAGTPWWPLAALAAGAGLVRLLRHALRHVLRYQVVIAGMIITITLAPQLTAVVMMLAAGAVLALIPFHTGRQALAVTHNRAWLAIATTLVMASFAGLAVEQARAERRQAADDAQASALSRAALLPPTPQRAVSDLLNAVAGDDPTVCTLALSPAAGTQLAVTTGAADCPGAIHSLASRVVDPLSYGRPDSGAITITTSPDRKTSTADACHLSWNGLSGVLNGTTAENTPQPGPHLGRLDLVRILGRGYQIVGFTPC